MAANFEQWKKQTLGHKIDLDNQSFDCVDVPKYWGTFATGKPWQECCGWGNAKDIYYNWAGKYWEQIPKGNQPKVGDVVVMNGTIGGGYGHTGVVVEINGGNMTIYQQNTFTQQAVYTGVYSWNASYITGFLRPKFAFDVAQPSLEKYQRVVGEGGVNYREKASRDGKIIKTFPAGDVLDFKGFVRGEVVDGNNLWYVGKYTSGYAWSGGFTDKSTHDLADLTPVPPVALQPYQRQIAGDAMNYRKAPQVAPDNVIQVYPAGEVLDFKGYVHGQNVDNNDIWFVGKYTGGYIWSGGFKDTGTHDLPDLTATPTPTPPNPTPTPPEDISLRVIDISSHNPITNYDAVKAAVRGVVAKAGHTGKSYGGTPVNGDPTFQKHKDNLGDKLVSAYWYGYASLNPDEEAKAFHQTVGDVSGRSFSWWLDIEEADGKTKEEINTWCKRFLTTLESLTKQKAGLYMNRNWYNNWITSDTRGDRPIWLAHYDTAPMSNPVPNQVAHQYTSKGAVPGIQGNVDMNAVIPDFFPPASPVTPTPPSNDLEKRVSALEAMVQKIVDWIKSFKP